MRMIDADALIEFCAERWIPLNIDAVNMQPTIQPEKAQLSKEGTTKGTASDLISKTETVEHLRRMLEATVPNTDYDEGFVDGVEFGVSTVSTMPTIQPVATDTNVGDAISRQAALEKVRAMQTYKLFMGDDMILVDKAEVQTELMMLPSAQPEPKEGEWVQIQRCARDAQPDLECPFCKHRIGWFDMGRYCAGCGAKLKGGAG